MKQDIKREERLSLPMLVHEGFNSEDRPSTNFEFSRKLEA